MAAHVLQRSCPEVLNWIYSQVTLANCVSLGSCVKLFSHLLSEGAE